MRIKQYQAGGIYYTPYFRDGQQSGATQAASTSSSGSSGDKEEQLIQKEIVSVLKENGLPNDVDFFLGKANSFLSKSQGIGSLLGSGSSSSYDMSDLIQLRSLANRVRHNNALYTEATDRIKAESSGSEVAVTNDGKLYAVTENGLKTITADQYSKSPENYRLLSNTDLVHMRAESPTLSYNGSILSDLANSVGMKSIVDYVKNTIGAFGTSKADSSFDKYTAKVSGKMERGFEQLLGLGPNGVYKVGEKTSQSDQGYSSKEDLDLAVNYLYKTLPANMRNVLKANAAAEGLDPTDPDDVRQLLRVAVMKHTDHSVSRDLSANFEGDATKAAGGKGSSGSEGQVADTFGNMVQKGMGQYVSEGVVPGVDGFGGNVKFNLPGIHHNVIQDQNGKQINTVTTGTESYQNFISNGMVDTMGKTYFGDIALDNLAYNGSDILIDNSKGFTVMNLPTRGGELDTGIMEEISRVQSIINDRHISSSDEAGRAKIWEENGFEYDPVTKTGVLPDIAYKKYIVQDAYTTNKGNAVSGKDLRASEMLVKVSNDIVEGLTNIFKTFNKKSDLNLRGIWNNKTYAGKLYIPLSANQNEALLAGGIGYTGKASTEMVKARQDAAYVGGGYNSQTRSWERSLNGTRDTDLDD